MFSFRKIRLFLAFELYEKILGELLAQKNPFFYGKLALGAK